MPILPETSGRVAEVKADFSAPVAKVDLIFRLDSSKQEAALETAKLIDRVGLVHALLMRIQALLLPAKTRVLSGH